MLQLFDLADAVERIFSSAGLEYGLAGGLAAYFYVEEAAPDAGRLTKDIDIVVRREDLEKIVKAAALFGFNTGRWRGSICWSGLRSHQYGGPCICSSWVRQYPTLGKAGAFVEFA